MQNDDLAVEIKDHNLLQKKGSRSMNCVSFVSCEGVPVSVAKSPQVHGVFLNSVWVIVNILLRLCHGQQDASNFQGCQVF